MGFFDKLISKGKPAPIGLSEPEAIMTLALAAVTADGEVDRVEVDKAYSVMLKMKALQGYDIHSLSAVQDRMVEMFKELGRAAMLAAAKKGCGQDSRRAAFILALQIIFADDEVTDAEESFLNDLSDGLGLTRVEAMELAKTVVTVKTDSDP